MMDVMFMMILNIESCVKSEKNFIGIFCILICICYSLTALAAINPASPGLAKSNAYGEEGIPNNGSSAICVECHTENPKPNFGTHFVVNDLASELRETNSGGGWNDAMWGIRDNGEFLKISPWAEEYGGSGGLSKYGNSTNWESVMFIGNGGAVEILAAESVRQVTMPEEMAELEIICESCHSLRVNVEGRYNLLSNMTDSIFLDDSVDGAVASLCVGCHGFLYQNIQVEANSLNTNWLDPRNISLAAKDRRGNNELHYISALPYPRNHHVMTGDIIDHPIVNAGLTIRDVNVLSSDLVSIPIRTDSRKGTMPIREIPLPPLSLPTDPLNLHCLTCHAPAHGGDRTMGAAILRGENLLGLDGGFGIDRISDGKEWGRFRDSEFCLACHNSR